MFCVSAHGRAALYALTSLTLMVCAVSTAADTAPGNQAASPTVSVLDEGERTVLKTAADRSFAAYVVGPKDAPRGLLVLAPGGDLSEQARDWANHFAALGYRAIAIDIVGESAKTPPKARGPIATIDQNDANAKHRAALEALNDPGRKLGVIGWCAGGRQALEASLAAPDLVSATVLYYAPPFADAKRLAHLKSPVLAVYAKHDKQAPAEQIKAFEAAMRQAGQTLEVRHVGREEPCANPAAISYAKESAQPTWEAARDFLNRYLQ
ncbi:MAG: dienelactone hydrolase family protein [Sulfurifustis sp.]